MPIHAIQNTVIVKASSGPRYVVGVRTKLDKEKLVNGTRVALDMTTLTIMRALPREVDPVVYNMLHESPGHVDYSAIGGLGEQIRELRESIELPLMNPELFLRVGIDRFGGFPLLADFFFLRLARLRRERGVQQSGEQVRRGFFVAARQSGERVEKRRGGRRADVGELTGAVLAHEFHRATTPQRALALEATTTLRRRGFGESRVGVLVRRGKRPGPAAAADADDAPKRLLPRVTRVRAVLRFESSALFASQPRRELGLRRAHERTERACRV